jgi:glycosyltransferase involved in cell wall biosynthesis
MKLLITSPSPERGGVEEYALTIAMASVQEGWEVHAAFPQTHGTTSLINNFAHQGVHYHPQQIYPMDGGRLQGMGQNVRRLRQAIALLRNIKPDVVMVNLPLPVQSLDMILACALFKIPSVIIFHSIPERLSFNKYKLHLYHWAQARNQKWIGVSEYNCKLVCESFQLAREHLHCIYNGVKLNSDLGQLDSAAIRTQVRQELGLSSNSRIILTVGRLDLEKGYGDLASVIPEIIRKFPGTKFVWVGEGQHRDVLTQQVQQYGAEDHVLFLGYRTDVPTLLKSADLFVFPTHYEGMPFALLEAMAHNLPILSSDVSGIPEILEHQVQGLLFCGGDRADLHKTLYWALHHPDQMQAFAFKAKQRVQDFSEERMVKEILTVFENEIGRRISKEEAVTTLQ